MDLLDFRKSLIFLACSVPPPWPGVEKNPGLGPSSIPRRSVEFLEKWAPGLENVIFPDLDHAKKNRAEMLCRKMVEPLKIVNLNAFS